MNLLQYEIVMMYDDADLCHNVKILKSFNSPIYYYVNLELVFLYQITLIMLQCLEIQKYKVLSMLILNMQKKHDPFEFCDL